MPRIRPAPTDGFGEGLSDSPREAIWDNPHADPLGDIRASVAAMKENTGLQPTVWVVGRDAVERIEKHFGIDFEELREEVQRLIGGELEVMG